MQEHNCSIFTTYVECICRFCEKGRRTCERLHWWFCPSISRRSRDGTRPPHENGSGKTVFKHDILCTPSEHWHHN